MPTGKQNTFAAHNPPSLVFAAVRSGGPVSLANAFVKRIGLATESDQIRWLLRKADVGGFSIPGQWVDAKHPESGEPIQLPNFRVDAIPEGKVRGVKEKDSALIAVRFEGVLTVTDPDRFRETVYAGIGSGKGFGFGLLSVAPA